VVTQLRKRGSRVTVGGTSDEGFESSRERWYKTFPEVSFDAVGFLKVDREVSQSLAESVGAFDLVVHTAGPFQGKVKTPNGVLAACVDAGVPYIDVCDDYCTAMAAKSRYGQSVNSPCIVSTGCWPGVSSLMAKQLVQKALSENPELTAEDLEMDFSFFTAGSGGAGATLLVATFLILAEKALVIQKGRRREIQPMKEYDSVNFGDIVGNKDISHLNLLETASVHEVLGVGTIETKFGTAPGYWNTLLGLMAQLPSDLLSNEELMSKLAVFSLPIVRIVDFFAGATNAMRVDIRSPKDPSLKKMALYAHENLEPCVGECVVAFASAVLSDAVENGVWFPEEAIEGGADAAQVLELAAVGAHTTETSGIETSKVWGKRG
ncbi:MAG: hypothetical protein AAGJ35_11400, partial [Myxococcota bacterium]